MSELSRALEARLNKQADNQTLKDEKPPALAKSGARPTPSKKPVPPPKNINSSVAKKINASLAQKDHKPPVLTPKPKVATKPGQLHRNPNTDITAKPSPGVVALANVLQAKKKNTSVETNGILPKNDATVENTTDSGALKETTPIKVSPKLSRFSKTKSVQFTKTRSASDATDRPFSTIDDRDDEFFDEGPRKRSSPVVTPSGSPSLAAHRKQRALTNVSVSFEAPLLPSSSQQSDGGHKKSAETQEEGDTKVDRNERSSSLPRDTTLSKHKGQMKKLLSVQIEKVRANSASDLRKLDDVGAKRRPPPPPNKPRGSKPPVQPKPGGTKPVPSPKPPTMAALKYEPQFSGQQRTSPNSREVTPDPVNFSRKSPSPGRPSVDSDSLEETLKASSSSHGSEGIEETLKGDNEEGPEWVFVKREIFYGTNNPRQNTLSPTPPDKKKPIPPPISKKEHSSESPSTKRNTPTPPTPPVKPGKSSPTQRNMSPDTPPKPGPGDDKLLKEEAPSPSILVTTTSSGSIKAPLTKERRSASDLTRSGREKTDSGFGSEVPDDLNLVRRASMESFPSSPSPPQVVKDPEVWDEARLEKARSKRRNIANELLSTEKTYVGRIKCIAVSFHELVDEYNVRTKQSIPASDVQQIFLNIQPIYLLNENLLQDLQTRMDSWSTHEGLGDVIARLAPFLKLYATYTAGFEDAMKTLTEWTKRDRKFDTLIREFERDILSTGLGVAQYMLEPVQRIPRYKLLVADYLKYLPPDSPDLQDTTKALGIISEAADHANDRIKELENSNEILAIQRSLTEYEGTLLAPSRVFLKRGELQKFSRKTVTPRMFFLFSDVLLHTQPSGNDIYRFRNEMPIYEMQIEEPKVSLVPYSFNVKSTTRSLILVARSEEEKQEWFMALKKTINDDMKKRSSLRRDMFISTRSDSESFGMKAPIMVPDKSVTMCQACSSEFTFTFRRHHCRACGKVVCGNCSQSKVYLTFMGKIERVCEQCNALSKRGFDDTDGEASPKCPKKQESTSSGVLNLKAFEDDAAIAGYVLAQDGRKWNRLWYQVKRDFVLYKFKAHEDIKAVHSMPLPGYLVTPDRPNFVINLIHPSSKKHLCDTIKIEDPVAFESWLSVLEKVVNMDMPEQTALSPTSKRSSLADSFDLPSRPASSVHSDDHISSSDSRAGSFSMPKEEHTGTEPVDLQES